MKRGMTINFSNRTLYTLIAVFSLLIISAAVYAHNSGGPPSVFGHSAEELEVTINGNAYNIQQAIDNNLFGGFGQCTLKKASATISTAPLIVLCDAGTTAVGGGCDVGSDSEANHDYFQGSYPSNDSTGKPNGWICRNYGTPDPYTAYAICCSPGSGSGAGGTLSCTTPAGIPVGSSGNSVCSAVGLGYVCTSVTAASMSGGTLGSSSATCEWVSTTAGTYKARCCKII